MNIKKNISTFFIGSLLSFFVFLNAGHEDISIRVQENDQKDIIDIDFGQKLSDSLFYPLSIGWKLNFAKLTFYAQNLIMNVLNSKNKASQVSFEQHWSDYRLKSVLESYENQANTRINADKKSTPEQKKIACNLLNHNRKIMPIVTDKIIEIITRILPTISMTKPELNEFDILSGINEKHMAPQLNNFLNHFYLTMCKEVQNRPIYKLFLPNQKPCTSYGLSHPHIFKPFPTKNASTPNTLDSLD